MTEPISNSPSLGSAARSLVDLLRRRARETPDRLAYQFLIDGKSEGVRLTYRELDRQAHAIRDRLLRSGQRADRALLIYPPGHEFLPAFFGCLYAGIIAIPLPPPDSARLARALPRLKAVTADAQASLVLTTAGIHRTLERHLDDEFGQLDWISTDEITAGSQSVEDSHGWEPSANDVAFLQYTSGSTSTPKGVTISHGNVLHQCRILSEAEGYSSHSVTATWMPYHHDYGLIEGLMQPLFCGVPCYFMSPLAFIKRPVRWLEAISRYRVTHSQAPNFAYDLCVRKVTPELRAGLDLSCWVSAAIAAEPIQPQTLRDFHAAFQGCGLRWSSMAPGYGLAEATLGLSHSPPGTDPVLFDADIGAYEQGRLVPAAAGQTSRTLVSSGRVFHDTRVEIVDPETCLRCEPSHVGEIWVTGQTVAQGYWNRPEDTAQTFQAHLADSGVGPFLRTGDLGCLIDGELYVTGRRKDLIIIRGLNHYPHDIELTVERSHPALRPGSGAAFSVEVNGAEELVVVQEIQGKQLGDVSSDILISTIRTGVLDEHELRLHAIVLLKSGDILKTTSGKIQRRAVKAAFLADELNSVADWKMDYTALATPSSLLKNVAWTPRPSENQSETDGRGVHPTVLQQADSGDVAETSERGGVSPPVLGHQPVFKEPGGLRRPAQEDFTADLRFWLTEAIGRTCGCNGTVIDTSRPFADFGLDSLRSVELANDLEAWLQCRVDPIVFWSHPNIEALAAHLAHERTSVWPENVEPPFPRQVQTETRDQRDSTNPMDGAIAIIGIGCRFPGGADAPEAFWNLLHNGIDAIGEVPCDRWDMDQFYDADPNAPGKMYTRHGGFVRDVDLFDAAFFRITPREAMDIDPQQRLLLQVAWESLEYAGIPASSLNGSETGVFIGLSSDDYATSRHNGNGNGGRLAEISAHRAIGTARSIAAGRIAYVLGLHGPVVQLDTACSSSLVAVYQACQSLREGECNLALAGGVNLMLAPDTTVALCKLTALAPDGRTKSFDAAADGYVRGEGCGLVVLKRMADAERDGDTILACIRGAAVNHDGASNGLTAPNGMAQERLIRKALQKAGNDRLDVSYVEAHGTGTPLGDPIELEALHRVYGEGRSLSQPLYVGSAKTNIGHLEAAAGIAGLVKVVLMLQHQQIAPQLHFQTPNPHLDWDKMPIQVATRSLPWPASNQRSLAAVSSFGFSGTNAHVILQAGPRPGTANANRSTASPMHILPISASNEESLRALTLKYCEHIATHPEQRLEDICFSASTARDHFACRLAVVADSRERLLNELRACCSNTVPHRKLSGTVLHSTARTGPTAVSDLVAVAELYVRSENVNWQSVFQPLTCSRVSIPTYAFHRQRFPLFPAAGTSNGEGLDALPDTTSWLPSPNLIAGQVEQLRTGLEDESHALSLRLDEVAMRFIINALSKLGVDWRVGGQIIEDELVQRVPVRHRPKVLRVLSRFAERGVLEPVDRAYRIRLPLPDRTADELLREIEREDSYPECDLLGRAGASLADIWKGDVEPLTVLFPDGSTDKAARFYSEGKCFVGYNRLAAEVLRSIVATLPAGRTVRVLEIGGGTGGLTRHLLPQLPTERSTYVFTDVSPLFLRAAKERFDDAPFLQTELLDISQPPEEQGFEPGSFDLIVAANVLHATPRLLTTLTHVRRLLKPNGWLLLLEGANPPLWGDMVFTLIDGWWGFEDKELRPDYPLMRRDRWCRVMAETGFPNIACLNDATLGDDSNHTLYLAQASESAETRQDFKAPLTTARTENRPSKAGTSLAVEHRPATTLVAVSNPTLIELILKHTAKVMYLPVEEIDPNQPLSDLGLDSLMAVELQTRLEQAFGAGASLNPLRMRRSIAEIATYLSVPDAPSVFKESTGVRSANHELDVPRVHLVPLQPNGSQSPLFFVPAGYGDLLAFQDVAHALGSDQPVYGLQPASAKQVKTIRQMSIYRLVSAYITEIKNIQPTGPYQLSGYSVGGIIAVELARELLRQGEKVGLLVVFDPPSHVPFWLDWFYAALYRICLLTRLTSLVRPVRSKFIQRLFHAVFDEGLRTHTTVAREHRVAPYPGRITHFRANLSQTGLVSLKPMGWFWRWIARDGVEVHWIPGTHYGMLRGAGAGVVVDELYDCLRRARIHERKGDRAI